jgi:DME family drug/metabolite transporter
MILAAASWALIGPVSRIVLEHGLAPVEVAFWRALIGGALFMGHAASRRQRLPRGRGLWGVVLFGLVGVAVFYLSYQLAVLYGGAALASVLLYTAPAWVTAGSRVFLGQPVRPVQVALVGLTLLGVALLGWPQEGYRLAPAGVFWGLVSGLAYALYYIYGKLQFARYAPTALLALALPVGALALWPWVPFAPKSGVDWLALVVLAFVSTYLAYGFYGRGLERLPAPQAALVATLEPVLASLLAFAWWGERFSALGYLGAALIVLAVALVALEPWFNRRRSGSHP